MEAYNDNISLDIEITNKPELSFEQVRVASNFGEPITVLGQHTWNRLKSTSDLSALIGQSFSIESEEWKILNCMICEDRKSIYYRNAMKLK